MALTGAADLAVQWYAIPVALGLGLQLASAITLMRDGRGPAPAVLGTTLAYWAPALAAYVLVGTVAWADSCGQRACGGWEVSLLLVQDVWKAALVCTVAVVVVSEPVHRARAVRASERRL